MAIGTRVVSSLISSITTLIKPSCMVRVCMIAPSRYILPMSLDEESNKQPILVGDISLSFLHSGAQLPFVL